MRFYHEREDGAPRQRMASTIVWFLLAADGVLLVVALAISGRLAARLVLDDTYLVALRLMLVNMFLDQRSRSCRFTRCGCATRP